MTTLKSRSAIALLAGTMLFALPAEAQTDQDSRQRFDLTAQNLGDALRSVAAQAGVELYSSAEDIAGLKAPPLMGEYTTYDAINQLLRGTELRASFDGHSVIIQRRASKLMNEASASEPVIVVTGTRIEGVPPAVPVTTVTSEDIRNAGQNDLGEVARSLPQNFGGGQNPGIGNNQGNFNENGNVNGASTFNLRGIGPNATLTLLNGNRFSYSGINSAIDVSAIPVAAVERVEIVADGASAIYGADAVAGVVNILLRRDYEGVSTSARLGGSTDGGNFQQQYNILGGAKWSSGGFMAAYDYYRNDAILAGDRSYATANNPANTLYPALDRHSFLLTGHQQVSPGISFETDFIYKSGSTKTDRPLLIDRPLTFRGLDVRAKFETLGIAPSLNVELGGDWSGRLAGFYGTDRTDGVTLNYNNGAPTRSTRQFNNRSLALEAGLQGPLFTLPAGDARLAVGGGIRENRIAVDLSGRRFAPQRENIFGYGELFIPLIRPEQGTAFAHRASITAALRWEDYSDSGSIVTPKIGFIFEPVKELSLGLSWGRSFKLPTLFQQFSGYTAVLLPISGYGASFPPGSNYLFLVGPNPEVGPEKSENWTLSATFRPSPHLKLVTSFFQIDYRDRVAPPFGSPVGILNDPIYADLITLNPAAAQLDTAIAGANGPLQNFSGGVYDPAGVAVLLDGRDRNIAVQRYRGADLSLRYRTELARGRSLTLTAGGSWLDSRQRLLPGLPQTDLSGTIFNASHFRARGGVSFGDEHFAIASYVSHSSGITDNRRAIPVKLSSFTTIDLTGRIQVGDLAEISVSALNILNTKPQAIFVANPADGPFDTTNYSAVGRFLGITISRNW